MKNFFRSLLGWWFRRLGSQLARMISRRWVWGFAVLPWSVFGAGFDVKNVGTGGCFFDASTTPYTIGQTRSFSSMYLGPGATWPGGVYGGAAGTTYYVAWINTWDGNYNGPIAGQVTVISGNSPFPVASINGAVAPPTYYTNYSGIFYVTNTGSLGNQYTVGVWSNGVQVFSTNAWVVPGTDFQFNAANSNQATWYLSTSGTDGTTNWSPFIKSYGTNMYSAPSVGLTTSNRWGSDWVPNIAGMPAANLLTNGNSDQLNRQAVNAQLAQGAASAQQQYKQLDAVSKGVTDLSNLTKTQGATRETQLSAATNSLAGIQLLQNANNATLATISNMVAAQLPGIKTDNDNMANVLSNLYVNAASQLAGQSNASSVAVVASSNQVAAIQSGLSNVVAAVKQGSTNSFLSTNGAMLTAPGSNFSVFNAMSNVPNMSVDWSAISTRADGLAARAGLGGLSGLDHTPLSITLPLSSWWGHGIPNADLDFGESRFVSTGLVSQVRAFFLFVATCATIWACFHVLRGLAPE